MCSERSGVPWDIIRWLKKYFLKKNWMFWGILFFPTTYSTRQFNKMLFDSTTERIQLTCISTLFASFCKVVVPWHFLSTLNICRSSVNWCGQCATVVGKVDSSQSEWLTACTNAAILQKIPMQWIYITHKAYLHFIAVNESWFFFFHQELSVLFLLFHRIRCHQIKMFPPKRMFCSLFGQKILFLHTCSMQIHFFFKTYSKHRLKYSAGLERVVKMLTHV